MTDRELLELAAKGAGIKKDDSPFNGGGEGNDGFELGGNLVLDWHNTKTWNPLTDNGDALELLSKLPSLWSLKVMFGSPSIELNMAWGVKNDIIVNEFNGEGTDRAEVIRRVIVLAAAEVGKKL